MIMKGIKTTEDAQKLPERNNIGYKREVVDGKAIIPYFRDIVAIELEDDNILAFLDTDGRMMLIGYDAEGAYKYAV